MADMRLGQQSSFIFSALNELHLEFDKAGHRGVDESMKLRINYRKRARARSLGDIDDLQIAEVFEALQRALMPDAR